MQSKAPYVLDDQIGFVLRRVMQRHLAIFSETIPEITPTQFAVLARLAQTGPSSQNLLGRETAMDAATIKGVVDRLVKLTMVFTDADTSDKRRLIVRLTPEGRALFTRTRDAALAVSLQTLGPLTIAERATLLALLARLV